MWADHGAALLIICGVGQARRRVGRRSGVKRDAAAAGGQQEATLLSVVGVGFANGRAGCRAGRQAGGRAERASAGMQQWRAYASQPACQPA